MPFLPQLAEKKAEIKQGKPPTYITPHILITTRYPNWKNFPQPLQVNAFNAKEGESYITKQLPNTLEKERIELLNVMSFSPLALSMSVSFIKTGHYKLRNFLSEILSLSQDHLQYIDLRTITQDLEEVYHLIIKDLKKKLSSKEYLLAEEILHSCAYIAPGNIPYLILKTLSQSNIHRDLISTIKILVKYSLLQQTSNDYFNIRPIIQSVIRKQISLDKKQQILARVLRLLTNASPLKDPHTDSAIKFTFMPHLETVIAHYTGSIYSEDRLLASALYQLGSACAFLGDKIKQCKLWEKVLHIKKQVYGDNSSQVSDMLAQLGNAYGASNDTLRQRILLKRADEIKANSQTLQVNNSTLEKKQAIIGPTQSLQEILDKKAIPKIFQSTPITKSNVVKNIARALPTRSDGDGAFHAVFGVWNEVEKEVICTNVVQRRSEV